MYIWEVAFYFQYKLQEVPLCRLIDNWMGNLLSLFYHIFINGFLVFDTISGSKCSYNMNAFFSVDLFMAYMPECKQQLRPIYNNKRRYDRLHTSNLGCFVSLREPCNKETKS